jgi:hypothetical protein
MSLAETLGGSVGKEQDSPPWSNANVARKLDVPVLLTVGSETQEPRRRMFQAFANQFKDASLAVASW